jgi:hypothetical protein
VAKGIDPAKEGTVGPTTSDYVEKTRDIDVTTHGDSRQATRHVGAEAQPVSGRGHSVSPLPVRAGTMRALLTDVRRARGKDGVLIVLGVVAAGAENGLTEPGKPEHQQQCTDHFGPHVSGVRAVNRESG